MSGRVKSCGCYNREKGRKPGGHTAKAMWIRYLRKAAKSRSIPFGLTDDEVLDICARYCNYCGAAPQPWEGAKHAYLTSAKRARTRDPDISFAESKVINLNGIDRIDPSIGYTLGNVAACCRNCSAAKLDMTLTEFKSWVRRVYNYLYKEET